MEGDEDRTPNATIVDEGGMFKVLFAHEGVDHTLGLFGTLEEAHRVSDVLTIKACVDADGPLDSLPLHFDLSRYGVDNQTAGEIRCVTFYQVVQDLQVCAVQPLHPAPGDTQATSWANAGGALTTGTTFHEALSHRAGARDASAAPHRATSRGPAPSAAVGFFQNAGMSLAATAAAAVAEAQDAALAALQPQLEPAGPAMAGQEQEQQGAAQPSGAMNGVGVAGGQSRQARKRKATDEEEEAEEQQQEQDDEEEDQEEDEQQQLDEESQDGEASEEEGRANGAALAAADTSYSSEEAEEQPSDSEQGWRTGGGRAAPTPAAKRRRSAAAGLPPGERPWQEGDPLAFPQDDHPFHGITRMGTSGKMAAQLTIKLSQAGGQPTPRGRESRNLRLAACSTAAEAAACWDVAAIWRELQYGQDPTALDAAGDPKRRLNFSYSRHAALLPRLRQCGGEGELLELAKALRDEGALAAVARGRGAAPAEAPAARAPAAAPPAQLEPAAAEAAAEGEGEAAAATSPRGGRRRRATVPLAAPKGKSTYPGVMGEGPWTGQVSVSQGKVLKARMAQWDVMTPKARFLRVGSCATPELAAACVDLMKLWRCHMYDEERSAADLSFPLEGYLPLLPGLEWLAFSAVAAHLEQLRDAGSLQAAIESPWSGGGRRRAGAPSAAAAAPPPASPAAPPSAAAGAPAAASPRSTRGAAAASAASPRSPRVAAAAAAAAAASPRSPRLAARAAAPAPAPAPVRSPRQAAGAPAPAPAPARPPPAAAPAAARPRGRSLDDALAAARDAGSQEARLAVAAGMSGEELWRASFAPFEADQVAMQEAMFAGVEAALGALRPELDEAEAVAFMASFVVLRDMRALHFRKITAWSQAGEHGRGLMLHYVRAVLGQAQARGPGEAAG